MSILKDLARQRQLFARCPSCDEEFRLSKAGLFDATKPLPERALNHLDAQCDELECARRDLKKRRLNACTRPRVAAETVTVGKVVEKIAPSLPGFPLQADDCRSLFELIDYIVFQGLAARGKIESVLFVDIKSGRARLSTVQVQVRDLVEAGRVDFTVDGRRENGK